MCVTHNGYRSAPCWEACQIVSLTFDLGQAHTHTPWCVLKQSIFYFHDGPRTSQEAFQIVYTWVL